MKKLLWLAALCGAWLAPPAAAGDETSLRVYKLVVANADAPQEFGTILEHLKEQPQLRDQELVDYLVEALWTFDLKPGAMAGETRNMLARGLAKWAGPRYVNVFKTIRANHKPNTRFRVAVDEYLSHNRKATEPQYEPGTVNFTALREQYAKTALEVQPTEEQARAMSELPVNADLDALVSKIGLPQAVNGGQLRFNAAPVIEIRIQNMNFYYRGLGYVAFQYKNGIGWMARKRQIDPEAFEDLMPYRRYAAKLGLPDDDAIAITQLLSGRPIAVEHVGETRAKGGGATRPVMDVAAELLLANHISTVDPFMVDAYVWLCRMLQHEGGPRYAGILSTVATAATSEKLRSVAAEGFESSAPTTGESYVPGSVSLAALRETHPPLYPERKLTGRGFRAQSAIE